MNALAATNANQISILAALQTPVAAMQGQPAFLNLISALFGAAPLFEDPALQNTSLQKVDTTPTDHPVNAGVKVAPKQLADVLIRSMLRGSVQASPVAVKSTTSLTTAIPVAASKPNNTPAVKSSDELISVLTVTIPVAQLPVAQVPHIVAQVVPMTTGPAMSEQNAASILTTIDTNTPTNIASTIVPNIVPNITPSLAANIAPVVPPAAGAQAAPTVATSVSNNLNFRPKDSTNNSSQTPKQTKASQTAPAVAAVPAAAQPKAMVTAAPIAGQAVDELRTTVSVDEKRVTVQTDSGPSTPPLVSKDAPGPAPLAEVAFDAQLTPLVAVAAPQAAAVIPVVASTNDPVVTPAPPLFTQIVTPATAPVVQKPETSKQPQRADAVDGKVKPLAQDRQEAPVRVAAIAAPANQSGFGRAADVPLTPASAAPQSTDKSETTFGMVAETLRTAETTAPAPVATANMPLQHLTMRIAPPNAAAVDLQISERGGEIHVSVRTPDSTLQTSLRQDLGTLTNSLERAGYRAETFVPRETAGHVAKTSDSNLQDDRSDDPRHSQQESAGRGGSGDGSGGRRDQRQRASVKWLEELEKQ